MSSYNVIHKTLIKKKKKYVWGIKYPVVTNEGLNNLSVFVQFYWSDNRYCFVWYSYRNDLDCIKLNTNDYFMVKNNKITNCMSNPKIAAELKYVRSLNIWLNEWLIILYHYWHFRFRSNVCYSKVFTVF